MSDNRSPDIHRLGILQQLKEDGGFWLPNDLIDLHAEELGPRPLFLYLLLARCITQKFYPSLREIVYISKYERLEVVSTLMQLVERKLLNSSDIQRIRGFPGNKKEPRESVRSRGRIDESDASEVEL